MRNRKPPEGHPHKSSRRIWVDTMAIAYAANAIPVLLATALRFLAIAQDEEPQAHH